MRVTILGMRFLLSLVLLILNDGDNQKGKEGGTA
ncbi:hypothetical protein T05_4225 [Trichinella murrelli]|uniref:Uncharacterized protein n=1 Tax=Trichinella murrelli TaxID=144512 RepID=A0A0V0SST6_9BILA|nr:hypothetical protein T05_4225 [Trichinella murrelli]